MAQSTSTLSTTSYSSTTTRSSPKTSDDDDEIVWNVSEGSGSAQLEGVDNDDFVLVAHPQSDLLISIEDVDEPSKQQKTPISATKLLEMQMSSLSLSSKPAAKKAKKVKRSKKATASSVPDTTTRNSKRSAASSKQGVSEIEHLGLGQRPIIDDLSERLSVISEAPTVYEEASTFISMFLSNPDAKTDHICRLALLQSLIIELGLGTSSTLPPTLTAAKAFLKAHAFLNIQEYMAVRGQGPEAVQSVMYPSKSALIKSIRKKRNRTSIKWVKELGLQVLLVELVH